MTLWSDVASALSGAIVGPLEGQEMTLRHFPEVPADGLTQAYNSVTRTVSTGDPVDYTVKGVVDEPLAVEIDGFSNEVRNGKFAKARVVLIPAAGLAIVPQPQDQLYFDGAWWTIKGNSEVSPAGTPLIFQLGVVR